MRKRWLISTIVLSAVVAVLLLVAVSAQASRLNQQVGVVVPDSPAPNTDRSQEESGREPLLHSPVILPPGDDCESSHGHKIKCLNEELLAATCGPTGTVSLLSQPDLDLFTPAELEEMERNCAFATTVISATTPAEFMSVGMNRYVTATVEYEGPDGQGGKYKNDGNGDGVCQLKKPDNKEESMLEVFTEVAATSELTPPDPPERKPNLWGEWCAEVISDTVDVYWDDDDGFCELRKFGNEWKLEPCQQISDAGANIEEFDGNENNFNEDKLVALENYLEDNLQTVQNFNHALATKLNELRTLRASAKSWSEDNQTEWPLPLAHTQMLTYPTVSESDCWTLLIPDDESIPDRHEDRPHDYGELHDLFASAMAMSQ